jgi:hypothetical protein
MMSFNIISNYGSLDGSWNDYVISVTDAIGNVTTQILHYADGTPTDPNAWIQGVLDAQQAALLAQQNQPSPTQGM